MFKRYFHVLKNYNRICPKYHPISYKFIEHCFEKKQHTFLNIQNIQEFNFGNFVANSLPVSADKLENKIINLCIYLRNGRVFIDDLEQVIHIYEETDFPLLKDVSLVLLKCCGELLPNVDIKTRQKLTERVWNLIQNKECQLTLEHYNNLLAVYAQNSQLINPQEFLDKMKIKPNESIYCSLLNVISKVEDYEVLSKIILKFGENFYSWNKKTFDAVIEAHAMQGNIKEADETIKKMQTIGIKPSPETYLSLTFGYAKLGDITNIVQIFEKNQPSIEHVMKVVKILSSYGYGKHIPDVLKFLTTPFRKDKLFIVNNTIIELTYSGQKEDAFNLITHLPTDSEIIDACIEYVKCFLSEEIKLNTSDKDILQVIRELMHNKQLPQIVNTAAEVTLFYGKEALALSFFEDMRKNNMPVRSHYYWPLFLQAHKYQDKNKLYSLLSHMISLEIEIDEETLIDYIFPSMDVTNPAKAVKTIIDAGINYPIAISSMGAFLLQNNRIRDAISLCSTFNVKFDFRESYLNNSLIKGYKKSTNMSTYVPLLLQIPYVNNPPFLYILTALLDHAKNSQKLEQFIEFLEMLKKQNVKLPIMDIKLIKDRINEITTDTNIIKVISDLLDSMNNEEILSDDKNNLSKSLSKSILSPLPHPKKMNSEELQNHIIELKNKNMDCRGALRKLLIEHCEKNNLKGAEELKGIIISNGFEWSPGMSAFLFHLYLKNNALDKAEIELMEIQNNYSNFLLDGVKIILYANCLVNNNRLKDAFNAINSIKSSKKVPLNNKCFQLLNTIANSEYYDSTEKMLETLVNNNYCQITNNLLIPLFQKHFHNNDIESVVNIFIHCVNKYKKTPLKQKIILKLVNDMNLSVPNSTENLKRVLKCISDVHGEKVALIQLITALAETKQVEKLQRVFENQEVSMKMLFSHLERYNGNDDHVFSTLFDAGTNAKYVPINDLCDGMISIHEKRGDCEKAKLLLSKMEAANIRPSKYFYDRYSILTTNATRN